MGWRASRGRAGNVSLCETALQPVRADLGPRVEDHVQDVLDRLNEALTALRMAPEVSREDARAIQKAIVALDVTLRVKTLSSHRGD